MDETCTNSSSVYLMKEKEEEEDCKNDECGILMRSVTSVCLSVCPVCALTFESLDLETPFLVQLGNI